MSITRNAPAKDDEVVGSETATRRTATVYDAVAGRVGLNGFLTHSQLDSDDVPSLSPEEVLLRRVAAPDTVPVDFYEKDEKLSALQKLPDSDLLKDLHSYVSDFYQAATMNGGRTDYRSMDETALLAMGILLEEACKESLGENGDMALVEPEGLEYGLPPSKMTKYQIIGRVVPQQMTEHYSSSEESQAEVYPRRPRKRLRSRAVVDDQESP